MDEVGLREIVRLGVAIASSRLQSQLDSASNGEARTVDSEALLVLDRLAQLGAILIQHRVEALWDELMEGLLKTFRLAVPANRGASAPSDLEARILTSIMHRVYLLGAFATMLKQYGKVKTMALKRPVESSDSYYAKVFWHRYTVTMASRGGHESAFKGKSLIGPASEYIRDRPQFFTLFDNNLDTTVNAMCQFDFLNCIIAVNETSEINSCYPNFGGYWNYRTVPIIRELVINSDVQDELGLHSQHELAQIITELDRLAAKVFFQVSGWDQGQWDDPEVAAFLAKHKSDE